MKNKKNNISKIREYLKTKLENPKIKYSSIATLVLLLVIWGFFWSKKITEKFKIPKVIWANFSLEYRKIPFDTKTLEISLSMPIDSNSINQKSISISPYIEWTIELKNENTLVYNLSKNLEIWSEYSLTISKKITWTNWIQLEKDYIIIFEAVAWVKVNKIIPEWKVEDLSSSILVFFNIPVLPLTTLDNQDNIPCPIIIEPQIEWKCRWNWWWVLEFVPKKHLEWATKYSLKVKNSSDFFYPLKEEKEITFTTPELKIYTDNEFSVEKWIELRANFPIDSNEIENKIKIKDVTKNQEIKFRVESIKWNETKYIVKVINWNWNYGKNYYLSIPANINSKYWNIPTSMENQLSISSRKLLNYTSFYWETLSKTWAIINTKNYPDNQKIGIKNIYIIMSFDKEMELNKDLFEIVDKKWNRAPYEISYEKEASWERWKLEEKITKKLIKLKFSKNLESWNQYILKLLKKADQNLEKDEEIKFSTAPKLEINSFQFINNSTACLYINNDLWENFYWIDYNNSNILEQITTTPTSTLRWISKDSENRYNEEIKFICPTKPWLLSYIVNIRLNPNTDYEINIPSTFMDSYWNELGEKISYKVKSKDIEQKDKYIYSSFKKEINVIPDWLDPIINIQSINLDRINVDICQMNTSWYLDYVKNKYTQWFKLKCINSSSKQIELKNKFWQLSNNRLDIEKDINSGKIEQPIYLIKWSIDGTKNDGKYFENIIIRTNLSLVYEQAKNKKLLFVTSIDGSQIIENLQITDENGAWIKNNFNPEKKTYELDSNFKWEIIKASSDKYFWVISINSDQTSNYDFKYISGQDSSIKDYLYIYTERPIYRPGDTVFLKWLLRKFSFDWYHKSDTKAGKLKIINENYELFKEIDIKIDKNSNFSSKFELPKDMKLGKFMFEFYPNWSQENIYNDWNFFVEEYVKPAFKINISQDKKDYVLWEKVTIDFDWEYYFGGKLPQAKYFKNILSQNYFFDAKEYSDYNFGDSSENFECLYWWYCNYQDETIYSGEWILQASWNDRWEWQLPKDQKDINWNNLAEKIYSFNITIEDPDTKKQINKTFEAIIHNTDGYVWIKSDYYVSQKNWIKYNWVVLNNQAQGLSDKNVKLKLYKREWKQAKLQWVDGSYYNNYSLDEKLEWEFGTKSSNKWEFGDIIIPKSSWEYRLEAIYTWNNGRSFSSSQYLYVAWDEVNYWNNGNNTTTDLIADKSILKVWDKAKFTLQSPVNNGKLFISIEKDDWILDYFTQDITSSAPRIEIPIKKEYYPNFYVKVYLLWKEWNNPIPVYKRALSTIKVVSDYKKIKVSIKPEKNRYLPWEKIKLTIKTTDENNNPIAWANWSIAVVDESVLALKWNPKKNPFAFFYEMKRYLWVETFLSLYNLIDKLDIKDITDWEKWWAWEWAKWWDSKKKRWIFKDTAFWQDNFTTDKNGLAYITTEALPDNLTTWNIESIVSTPTDNMIWIWETSVITTKKIIITDNLPRFLWASDEMTISPTIFNKTWKNSTFKITLSWENIDIKNNTKEIKINNWWQESIDFEIKTTETSTTQEKVAKINIKAQQIGWNEVDEIEKFLPIRETSIRESVATVWKWKNNTEKINLSGINVSDAKIDISYSPSLLSSLWSTINFLNTFVYSCLEQKSSAIMPYVHLYKLYKSINIPYELSKNTTKIWLDNDKWFKEVSQDELVKNFIAEAVNFQKISWWYSYWIDNNLAIADLQLTSIIVSSLSEIKKIWYWIDDYSIKKAIDYLKNRVQIWTYEWCNNSDCKYPVSLKLQAIKSILDYDKNDYSTYKLFKIIPENKSIDSYLMRLSIIANLKNSNITKTEKDNLKKEWEEIINKIINEHLVYNPRWAFLGKTDNFSRISNTATFVWVASELSENNKLEPIIDNMVKWIIWNKKDGNWWSTQDSINVIANLTKYISSKQELKNINQNVSILLNSELLSKKNIDNKNKLEIQKIYIDWNKLKNSNDLTFNSIWNWVTYYDISLSYTLPYSEIKPRDEGFYIEQKYYDYNEYRKIQNLKKQEYEQYLSWSIDYNSLKYSKNIEEYLNPINDFVVGQIVMVSNKITTWEPRDQVAIESYIPSWSELINTRLSTENQAIQFESNIFEREELRDDRYFWYSSKLDTWIYYVNYAIRMTQAGKYRIKPTNIFEFYSPEVFGRTGIKEIIVKK